MKTAKENPEQTAPNLESLTDEEAIFRAVRNKCLQSPFTVIPLALAVGLLLLSGAFGLGFFGVFASAVAAIIGSAAFVYNMWIRGEELTKEHVRELMETIKQDRRKALSEIATMCREIGFMEGEKEANELSEAYQEYTSFLETKAGAKLGASVGERMSLAESARQSGVNHLKQAAEIFVALGAVDIEALRREHSAWLRELETPDAHRSVLETKIQAHTQQISRFEQLALKRDQLIARVNELEAALKSAYLSEAGKSDYNFDKNRDNPATRLSNVINAAEAAETDMREFLEEVSQESNVIN